MENVFVSDFHMHWTEIAQLLTLTTVANGAPVIAQKFFGKIGSQPLDMGRLWLDKKPLLGPAKTLRGLTLGVLCPCAFAPLLGVRWTVGLAAGLAAMAGDLLSSFVKRRLGLAASDRATGLDQIPESLLPAIACASSLQLSCLDIIATTAIFFVGEIVLSKILYRLHIRARPF
jgi:CDP-diglyceride synthetase